MRRKMLNRKDGNLCSEDFFSVSWAGFFCTLRALREQDQSRNNKIEIRFVLLLLFERAYILVLFINNTFIMRCSGWKDEMSFGNVAQSTQIWGRKKLLAYEWGNNLGEEWGWQVCWTYANLAFYASHTMSLRPPQTESERKKNENQRGHLKAKLKYTLRFVKTGAHETNINKNMLFFFHRRTS